MERDKLTIRELAPYQPYKLKFKHQYGFDTMETLNDYYVNSDCEDYYAYEEIKPLLLPLSEFGDSDDLRKLHEFIGFGRWCEAYDQYFDAWFNDACSVDKLVLQAPYEVMQYFFSNHFDVFSLIPRNLAIDLTTINP